MTLVSGRARAATAGVVVVTVLAAGAVAVVRAAPDDEGPARPVVLVSGFDDHNLEVAETVDLLDAPEGRAIGAVAAGTLVAVAATRGEWLRVEALEGAPRAGWVNDFHLRGTLHLLGERPGCPVALHDAPGGALAAEAEPNLQVEVLGAHEGPGGALWLEVRGVADPGVGGFVPRAALSELPTDLRDPSAACEDATP